MSKNIMILLTLGLLILFSTPLIISRDYTIEQFEETSELKSDLIASCRSALIYAKQYSSGEDYVFESKKAREVAVEAFFRNYTNCLSSNMTTDAFYEARYYVPCIVMIDYNGYYIMYSKEYTDTSGNQMYTDIITPLYSWVESYGDCIVTYRLDDKVSVSINGTTARYEGEYDKVYGIIKSEYPSKAGGLQFMLSKEDFELEKNAVVIGQMNEQIEYFINTHNTFHNSNNTNYIFTMSQALEDTQVKMLTSPSFFAFSQYRQMNVDTDYVNIYAIAATDIVDEDIYYIQNIDETMYYHKRSCSHLTHIDPVVSGTMQKCAENGAEPCPNCVK